MVVSESIMLSNSLNDFMYYTQSRSWKVPTEHFGSVDAAKQLRYRRIRPAVISAALHPQPKPDRFRVV